MDYAREFQLEDLNYVAEHMRPEDIEEVTALGSSPLSALTTSVENSKVLFTLIDPENKPTALLGVANGIFPGWGAVWLLGTPSIERYRMTFLRNAKKVLPVLYEKSDSEVLYNYVYSKNDVHITWLRWMGFKFLRRVRLPPYDHEFLEFVRLRG